MNQEVSLTKKPLYWWIPLLFGVVFILIGYWILRSPEESFEKITKYIGIIILISGAIQLFFTLKNLRGTPGWGFQLAGDIFDLAVGTALVVNPSLLLKLITLFVGIFLMLLAVMFLWHPMLLGISIAIWTGLAFIILGIFRIVLTLRLRRLML